MALAYIALGEYVDGFKWLLQSIHLNPAAHTSAKFGFCLYYFHTGDYEESFKWIERLNAVENPLFLLIQLSLQGKINKKKVEITDNIIDMQDDALGIINRMIMDPALRLDIADGCKMAGLKLQ